MATKKRSSRKKGAVRRREVGLPNVQQENVGYSAPDIFRKSSFFSRRNIILLLLLIAAVLLWRFKGNFIAATVNGQPISRWELNDVMSRRFGDQTLDNLINERLILSASRQKGVFVTTEEINNRMKDIEEKLKGQMSLSDALSAQGLTESMFRRQIEIQLSIEKLFDKEATVSTQETEDYIEKNASLYKTATDAAQVRSEVNSLLKQQKMGDQFDTWFSEIRKSADIKKFL